MVFGAFILSECTNVVPLLSGVGGGELHFMIAAKTSKNSHKLGVIILTKYKFLSIPEMEK